MAHSRALTRFQPRPIIVNVPRRRGRVRRAARYIETPPVDPVDQIWYAYLYHQRPVDVRDSHMHGPAAEMSIELAADWHTDAHKLHRLMAANVVAWGDPAGAPVAHATDPGAS